MLEKIKNYKPNNIILFILAFIVAVVFWGWITIVQSPVETVVITDVPVTLSLPTSYQNSGYQIYGNSTYLVDVTISGKRFVVQEITAADLTATATTTAEISSGVQSLPIEVKTKESKMAKYEIVSLSKNSVSVFFDKPETRSFPIELNIITQAAVLNENTRLGDAVPSLEAMNVTGPSTELDKVSSIIATVTLSGEITDTKSYTPTVELKGTDETTEFKYSEIENETAFTITVPLQIQKELTLAAEINNLPETSSAEITFNQPTALFWIEKNEAKTVDRIVVATPEYSELTNINTLSFKNAIFKYEPININNYWYTVKLS